MLLRLGVRFTPKTAEIFDMIRQVSKRGGWAEFDMLAWVFYPDVPRQKAKRRIAVQVCMMKDLLADTSTTIEADRSLGYRVSIKQAAI